MWTDSVFNADIWNATYWEHVREYNTERWKTGDLFVCSVSGHFFKKNCTTFFATQEKTIFLQILLTSKDTCTLNSARECSRLHQLLSLYLEFFWCSHQKILDLFLLLWIQTFIQILSVDVLDRTRWNQMLSSNYMYHAKISVGWTVIIR